MKLEGEQTLLRVYLRNTDRHHWFSAPAVDTLVQRAKAAGLAGATVLRGFFGLDVHGQLLETKVWSLVDHAPVIVEVVDFSRLWRKWSGRGWPRWSGLTSSCTVTTAKRLNERPCAWNCRARSRLYRLFPLLRSFPR